MTDIPQEWVEVACLAYHETFVGEPAPSKRAAQINAIPMRAALAAVIPLIRADAEYPWKLIIAGGEDAPGAANALTLDCAEKRLDDDRREVWQLFNERDRYREALEEIARRTGLLIHQNTGRWDMNIEHDRRSYNVSDGNLFIARQALKGDT